LPTPKNRPIERKPSPSKYNCKAFFFTDKEYSLDFFSTVKLNPQPLHLYLCTPFYNPVFYLFRSFAFWTIHAFLSQKYKIYPNLAMPKNLQGVAKWEVDTTNTDKILSIEAKDGLTANEVMETLKNKGYQAQQL